MVIFMVSITRRGSRTLALHALPVWEDLNPPVSCCPRNSLAHVWAFAVGPAPDRQWRFCSLLPGLGMKSPSPSQTCVSTGPTQHSCLPIPGPGPHGEDRKCSHILLQPGDLWSLSPVARERVFKKTHKHVIKISVLVLGEGLGRLPPLLCGNTDF